MEENRLKRVSKKRGWLILLFAIFVIITCQNIFAEKPCGRLLGGFDEDCIVIRNKDKKEEKAKEMMLLFPFDVILQKNSIDEVNISLSPFAQIKKFGDFDNAVRIYFREPGEESLWGSPHDWLTFLEKVIHKSDPAATRAIDSFDYIFIKQYYPLPGKYAAVIPGESIPFAWESGGAKFLVIKDHKGKELYRKNIKSKRAIELNIDEIKMEPYCKYYWGVEIEGIEGIHTDCELEVLDDKLIQIVKDGFEEIADKKLDSLEEQLQKAAYIQYISNKYKGNIDLYWMSGRIIDKIDRSKLKSNEKELLLYRLLVINYNKHFEILGSDSR